MITLEERKKIKQVILEMAQEDEKLLQDILKEIIQEQLEEKERENKIAEIVKRDFKRFKATFEALA